MLKKKDKLSVCVMFGGRSTEHDISIISGLQVYNALNKDLYNVLVLYITKDNKMLIGSNLNKLNTYQTSKFKKTKEVNIVNINNKTYIKEKYKKHLVDVFVPVFHGAGTEDGVISSILEFYDATYITSNVLSSSLSQDKAFTKDILRKFNIQSKRYIRFKESDKIEDIVKTINESLLFPVIIKPINLGSSIGINVVNNKEELKTKVEESFKYDSHIIVEEVVQNKKEYNCACFKYNNHLYISSIEEVSTNNDILTFEDKYLSDIKTTNNKKRIVPATISEELTNKIKTTTKTIYQILNHSGIIRIDYLYDSVKNKLYFNEVNTIPGSYAFYLFDKDKLPFDKILDMLIKEAILKKKQQNKKIRSFSSNILSKNNQILKK